MENSSQRTYIMRCGCRLEQTDLIRRPHYCCPIHKERLDHVLLKCECGTIVRLELSKVGHKYCPKCYEERDDYEEEIVYNPKKEINDALDSIWPSTEIPEKYIF